MRKLCLLMLHVQMHKCPSTGGMTTAQLPSLREQRELGAGAA